MPKPPLHEVSADEMKHITARLGVEAAGFHNTSLGQYLLDRCDITMEESASAGMTINPTDSKKLADLQVDYRAAAMLKQWINEAINSGMEAGRQLNEQDMPDY